MTKPYRQFDATIQTTIPVESKNLIFSRLRGDGQMVTAVLRNAVRFYVENPEELKRFYSDLPHLFGFDGRNDKKRIQMIQFKIERELLNRLNALLVKGNYQSKQTVIARLILYLLDHPDEMQKFYKKKD